MIRRKWTRFRRSIGSAFRRVGFWWFGLVLSTLALCVYLSLTYWNYLHDGTDSLSTAIRNVSLIIGGIIAIELALWRSVVGVRQVDTAQRGLLNERFQKGAEMLGSENLSVRLGGIYALKHLAGEHPEQYHVQVMELLCAFVRHPTTDKSGSANLNEERQFPRADVNTIAEIICNRDESHLLLERIAKYRLDLSDADLRRISLTDADLTGAYLFGANLSEGSLMRANLTNARFLGTIFSELRPPTECQSEEDRSETGHALIEGANFSGAQFSHNSFHPAEGLLQSELNKACADPDNEPNLKGVIDASTGKPIVWQGRPCKDE